MLLQKSWYLYFLWWLLLLSLSLLFFFTRKQWHLHLYFHECGFLTHQHTNFSSNQINNALRMSTWQAPQLVNYLCCDVQNYSWSWTLLAKWIDDKHVSHFCRFMACIHSRQNEKKKCENSLNHASDAIFEYKIQFIRCNIPNTKWPKALVQQFIVHTVNNKIKQQFYA